MKHDIRSMQGKQELKAHTELERSISKGLVAVLASFLMTFLWLGDLSAKDSSPRKPAILFCSPSPLGAGYVDLTYLQELREQGFEVDYTSSLDDLTWERIQPFNILLLYTGARCGYEAMGWPKLSQAVFNDLIERFLK